jgi:predicted RNase H-like HicB family nuclease
MRYAVIIEEGESSFGAYVPDLPGCAAVAETREEVLELIREAIDFHIGGYARTANLSPSPLQA